MNFSLDHAAGRPAGSHNTSAAGSVKSVAIVSSGNFLEMFDFMVFAYYAPAIARTFFPAHDEFASLMLTLMTFGAGFLMRPIGGLVLGAYVDKHGRRKGLILTLALMGLGTLAIAATPGYARLGVAAPLIVLAGRLVQGLSAGAEVGGVSVYLSEIAPTGRRGFYVAWQSGSQQLAVITASLIGVIATALLGQPAMNAWGWRIPFILGCFLVPFLLFVRTRLTESPAFLAQTARPTLRDVYRRAARHSGVIVLGALIAVMTTVFFYMITAYTPTYGSKVLHLGAQQSLLVTLCVGLLNFALLPTMGALSDKVGRRPLLIGAALLALVSGYPAMAWLVGAPSFARLLTVELYFAVVYATYNGAMVVFLTEAMPPSLRTSAFSLAYSLATALFGGFTPAISTWLIHRTGNRAIPGAWLSAAALISLGAVLLLSRTVRGRLGEGGRSTSTARGETT